MKCETCGDVGIVKLNWQEGDEYGLCLCPAGEAMRKVSNQSTSLWRLWCAKEQVDPGKVQPIEDVLTVEELAAKGFRELSAPDALSAVAAAAKARGRRL